jgi:GNAT superfamily N-acetyltransferase
MDTSREPSWPGIKKVDFEVARRFSAAARADRVNFTDIGHCKWFTDPSSSIFVGCLMKRPGGGWRIRSIWVDPAHRGKGYGSKIIAALEGVCEASGASFIDVYAYNPAFYEQRRYKRLGRIKSGAYYLRRSL